MGSCHICSDNASQDLGEDKWGVARLTTGFVRLNPNQYFRGSCFFLAKDCLHELHEFERATRDIHLAEMAEVAAAVWKAFTPRKLNYEALGNGAPHLHCWITPRYESDPRPIGPIWEDMEFLRAQWPNDLPMLHWAGRSAAPANAHEVVLTTVDVVLADCDEDGVATLIEQLLATYER
jgi:diadenosine tetraphosphate (Ap4A) HIT family hydrolase